MTSQGNHHAPTAYINEIIRDGYLIQTVPALPVKPERIKSGKTQSSMANTPLFDTDKTGKLL